MDIGERDWKMTIRHGTGNGRIFIAGKGYEIDKDMRISDEDRHELKQLFEQKKQKFDNFRLKLLAIPSQITKYNLERILDKKDWNKIRYMIYERYGNKCSICNSEYRLSCHEVWEHDDINIIQHLKECVALCDKCHASVHITRSTFENKEGKRDINDIINHFMAINKSDRSIFDEYKSYINDLEIYRAIVCAGRTNVWQIDYGEYNDLVTRTCGDINAKIREGSGKRSIFHDIIIIKHINNTIINEYKDGTIIIDRSETVGW